jgi:hypothetical protein
MRLAPVLLLFWLCLLLKGWVTLESKSTVVRSDRGGRSHGAAQLDRGSSEKEFKNTRGRRFFLSEVDDENDPIKTVILSDQSANCSTLKPPYLIPNGTTLPAEITLFTSSEGPTFSLRC